MNVLAVNFSKQLYSNGTVVALLRGSNLEENAKLSVRAYAYMKVDPRWVTNLPNTNDLPSSEYLFSGDAHKSTVFCIFSTKLQPIEKLHLLPEGIFIQFDVPPDSLPTFKGMHGTIAYQLIVILDKINTSKQQIMYFPFKISSPGYHYPSLQSTSSSISVYPKCCLPADHVFSRIDDYDFLDEIKSNSTTYSIRDEAHVCNISFSSPIFQEDVAILTFDFDACEQKCFLIKSRFVLHEIKADGSLLNSKCLDAQKRHTAYARRVHMRLQVPIGSCCTFSCPFFSVESRVEIEFYLEDKQEPFTWSLPVEILPMSHSYKSAVMEAVACLSSAWEEKAFIQEEFF